MLLECISNAKNLSVNFFDLVRDPLEKNNLADTEEKKVEDFYLLLHDVKKHNAPNIQERPEQKLETLNDKVIESLDALGYL